jgi:3-phosphoshikimate 1-carboxyvinyltransferase
VTVALSTAIAPAEGPLSGRVRVPGDKSVAQRAALLAAVADGRSSLRDYPSSTDAQAALGVAAALGVELERTGGDVSIDGRGWDGLIEPSGAVSCVRSGTAMRLATGLLAGAGIRAVLSGDPQLVTRPMERVAEPLRRMGAHVRTTDGHAPITVEPSPLRGVRFEPPVASAQVKSAVLLAGLRAEGITTVVEPVPTRDHTERLLRWLGVEVRTEDGVGVARSDVPPFELDVPGDPSSAAALLAAAAVVPGSEVIVDDVSLNPTRTAFLDLLRAMGADVSVDPTGEAGPEPVGRVAVRAAPLGGIAVDPAGVPALIDELVLVGAVAAFAHGVTEVRGADELRVKESDRIAGLVANLRFLGVDAEELPDGFVVRGPSRPEGRPVDARGDHRLAMAFSVLALGAKAPMSVTGMSSVEDSFPGFLDALDGLR